MSDVKFGVLFCIVMLCIAVIVGCAVTGGASVVDKIPISAWESTMNAVAKTNWFGTFCLLSFFGGIVAIGLDQRKIGSAVVIAAICTICLGLAIHRFPTWLAIIGFTSSVIAVGYSILIKKKALVEIIRGVESIRQEFSDDTIDKLMIDDCLSSQKESTKKIVKKIKDRDAHQKS